MPVVREGQSSDPGSGVVAGAAGQPGGGYPAAGVRLSGVGPVAPNVAAAAAAGWLPAAAWPPGSAVAGGSLSVLSETVTNVEFDAFYAMERTALVRFVMYLGCADADAAEDIAHAAFTRAFAAWATIRFPKAWLRKVAQNEYFRYCQAAAREIPLDAGSAEAARRVLSAAMALDYQAGLREDLAAAISELPPKQRQVMAWHWDGFSDGEIAIQLGDSEVAVRKNRSRALKNLRRHLDETGREAI